MTRPDMDDDDDARVDGPTHFGRYTLVSRLAVGGMAELFLARQEGLEGFEKTVVLKRIRPHLSRQPAFITMFLNEAKLAAQLNHPNIVKVYDVSVGDVVQAAREADGALHFFAVEKKGGHATLRVAFAEGALLDVRDIELGEPPVKK